MVHDTVRLARRIGSWILRNPTRSFDRNPEMSTQAGIQPLYPALEIEKLDTKIGFSFFYLQFPLYRVR